MITAGYGGGGMRRMVESCDGAKDDAWLASRPRLLGETDMSRRLR